MDGICPGCHKRHHPRSDCPAFKHAFNTNAAANRRKRGSEWMERPRPSAASIATSILALTKKAREDNKKEYCRHFHARGCCKWGAQCRHAHIAGPAAPVP